MRHISATLGYALGQAPGRPGNAPGPFHRLLGWVPVICFSESPIGLFWFNTRAMGHQMAPINAQKHLSSLQFEQHQQAQSSSLRVKTTGYIDIHEVRTSALGWCQGTFAREAAKGGEHGDRDVLEVLCQVLHDWNP